MLCGAISCGIGPVKFNGDLQFFIIAESLMQDGRRSVNSLSNGDRAVGPFPGCYTRSLTVGLNHVFQFEGFD
jgi:hypothetical protein